MEHREKGTQKTDTQSQKYRDRDICSDRYGDTDTEREGPQERLIRTQKTGHRE